MKYSEMTDEQLISTVEPYGMVGHEAVAELLRRYKALRADFNGLQRNLERHENGIPKFFDKGNREHHLMQSPDLTEEENSKL